MHVIPVLDLHRGQVVRAVRGERAAYRPIDSALCRSSEPVTVARCLADHCATPTLYLADLDALQGGAPQHATIAALLLALPRAQLWLDAGYATVADADALLARLDRALPGAAARVTPVFASEALVDADALRPCLARHPQALLSLDSRRGGTLGAPGLHARPALWPERLIVMTLDRVGSGDGPDLAALAAVRALAPRARLIGAGGIRHAADLRAAAAAGAQAWLVASALHDGKLPRCEAPSPPPGRARRPAASSETLSA